MVLWLRAVGFNDFRVVFRIGLGILGVSLLYCCIYVDVVLQCVFVSGLKCLRVSLCLRFLCLSVCFCVCRLLLMLC